MVEKSIYKAWEDEVIKFFFEPECKITELVPQDGKPTHVLKDKFILVAIPSLADVQQIEEGNNEHLPETSQIQLWHIGNQSLGGVSYGLDGSKFQFPACDLGGLTNCSQELHTASSFQGRVFHVRVKDDVGAINALADELTGCWSGLAGKTLPPATAENLSKWLSSVLVAFGADVALQFFHSPVEHLVLVSVNDVQSEVGTYYVRNFGGPHYAEESNGVDLFCAVKADRVVPNYNIWNIQFECRTCQELSPPE